MQNQGPSYPHPLKALKVVRSTNKKHKQVGKSLLKKRTKQKKLLCNMLNQAYYIYCTVSDVWQIVAVILCDTGVALLAYMDGITGSPTLSGVVLAAAAAAGSAVYKVCIVHLISHTELHKKLLLARCVMFAECQNGLSLKNTGDSMLTCHELHTNGRYPLLK